MRAAGMAMAAALALCAQGPAQAAGSPAPNPAAGEVVTVDFSNPGLSPPHWTLTLHPDGSGHFQSERGAPPADGLQEIDVPNVNRDIQVSDKFALSVFDAARHHAWFNQQCESRLKVAFQGWKKISYIGPQGQGSCTFNYSRDKEIQALGDSLTAVAETILEGARLEMLLQHDPLGLPKAMGDLVESVQEGRAQQLCAIRGILEKLEQDDRVMAMVRKQARMLLARAET